MDVVMTRNTFTVNSFDVYTCTGIYTQYQSVGEGVVVRVEKGGQKEDRQ